MSDITITQKQPNKHLNYSQYEYIINKMIAFNAKNGNKKRNIGKTKFITDLSKEIGTTVSNIYAIIKDATVTVIDTNLKEYQELSVMAAWNKRSKNKRVSNVCKIDKAKPFINLVMKEMKNNKLASVDETINSLLLHETEKIKDMETICTKTMYNYIHKGCVDIKPIELPRMLRRKPKKNYKTYTPKSQRGTSIIERPEEVETREEFGHWEGDLVTGPRDGKNGAYLTLIERKTRFYLMLPITSKSSKKVLMQINKLNKFYGDDFSEIFKSITFDNGSEFARWKDIEKAPKSKKQRTRIYFARPYHSSDRGSNENCNGLIRYYIKKGTDINTISKEKTIDINTKINNKKRKILGYLPAREVFLKELNNLNVTNNKIYYEH